MNGEIRKYRSGLVTWKMAHALQVFLLEMF